MNKSVLMFRHTYMNTETGSVKQTGWQDLEWYDYVNAWHRDCEDMGDENPLVRIITDTREVFINKCKEIK